MEGSGPVTPSPPGFPKRERPPRIGWDPREPGLLALALFCLLIAGLLPWWGFTVDTSRIPYRTSEGTDFGPWYVEEWQFQLLPGSVRREGDSRLWWEFLEVRSQYGAHGTPAVLVSGLWTLAVLSLIAALVFRRKARSRLHGMPTVLEAIAAGAAGGAIVVASVGFPLGAELSFMGEVGDMSWGPKAGWILGLLVASFASIAAALGWAADRTLRGKCWKCYRPATGAVCDYCATTQ